MCVGGRGGAKVGSAIDENRRMYEELIGEIDQRRFFTRNYRFAPFSGILVAPLECVCVCALVFVCKFKQLIKLRVNIRGQCCLSHSLACEINRIISPL